MAKQRGVVQLSGRVDNLCYYQQKRVRGGLVRRINLAMSERVKAGKEYVNLRTANSFWGGCSIAASIILESLGTRATFLTKANRQAILTREIYRMCISEGTDDDKTFIGFSNLTALSFPLLFEKIVKNKVGNFFSNIPYSMSDVPIESPISITLAGYELENYCTYYNSIGVRVSVISECYIYSLSKNNVTQKFEPSEHGRKTRSDYILWELGSPSLTISFGSGQWDDCFNYAFLCIQPLVRIVGGRGVAKETGSIVKMIGTVLV